MSSTPKARPRPEDRTTSDDYRRHYAMKRLNETSETNRAALVEYLEAKRAEGLKPGSLMNITHALATLDNLNPGVAFALLTPEQLQKSLLTFSGGHGPVTTSAWAVHVKGYFRWLNDSDLPKEIAKALRRRNIKSCAERTPISDKEFQALLRAADESARSEDQSARHQALLWALWDSGFRISELLSLQVRDFVPDTRGGAVLNLRPEEPNLKTGSRSIYVLESVPQMRLWLSLHHGRDQPKAYIFHRPGDLFQPLNPRSVFPFLKRCAAAAGVRHVHPHLFRHTRCTRAARAKWNEQQMRMYFGWSPGSTMPSIYTHLAMRDMTEQIRESAGVDDRGNRLPVGLDQDAFEQHLARMLHKLVNKEPSGATDAAPA